MITIENATEKDFESIYPLFADFNNPHLTKDDWRRLFQHGHDTEEGYNGLMMKSGGSVVGFIGLIFSKRQINEVSRRFLNLSGWIVKTLPQPKPVPAITSPQT